MKRKDRDFIKGERVVRGKDWKWYDQDGGEGSLGTVIGPDIYHEGWIEVKWDCGHKNNYRVGAQEAYDLLSAVPLGEFGTALCGRCGNLINKTLTFGGLTIHCPNCEVEKK